MTTTLTRLQPSALAQEGGIVGDVDLRQLNLNSPGRAVIDIRPRITDGLLVRTILGPSTVELTIRDPKLELLNSGYLPDFTEPGPAAARTSKTARTPVVLRKTCDIRVDGIWFRLVAFDKSGLDIKLTFEDRTVAVLRDYPRPTENSKQKGFLARSVHKISRAQFAKLLATEPKELKVQFVSPELTGKAATSKPERDVQRSHGFPPAANITVKNRAASPAQLDVIDRVLKTGADLKARRKVLVAAIMVITQESRAGAELGPQTTYVGVFQQSAAQGWPASGVPEIDAAAFFNAAIPDDAKHPNLAYEDLADDVQASGNPAGYRDWRTEAEHTVTAWGVPGGDSSTAAEVAAANGSFVPANANDTSFEFTRGSRETVNGKARWKREDNWTALQRLATEVAWRCFADEGTVFFLKDLDLFRSRPRMTITEAAAIDGAGITLPSGVDIVDAIDGNYDTGKAKATLTVTCRIGRWACPPGTLTAVLLMGPLSGRWLVQEIRRNLFKADATITLIKPQPVLPEELAPEWANPSAQPFTGNPAPGAAGGTGAIATPGTLRWPFATKNALQYRRVDQGWDIQDTAGCDVFAISDGKISVANQNPGGFGNDYPILHLDADIGGPSLDVYYGHVHVDPAVVGTHVNAGDRIARANRFHGENGSGAPPGWLEIGFGGSVPVAHGTGDSESAAGDTMKTLLLTAADELGVA